MKNIENLEDIFSKITQEKQECIANMSKHMGSEINDDQSIYDLLSKLAEEKGNVTDLDKKLDKSKITAFTHSFQYTCKTNKLERCYEINLNKRGYILVNTNIGWTTNRPVACAITKLLEDGVVGKTSDWAQIEEGQKYIPPSATHLFRITETEKIYVFGQWTDANTRNTVVIRYLFLED